MGGSRTPPPPGKSQVAIGSLRNSGTDPLEGQFDPLGPIASRGRFVRPHAMTKKTLSGSAHEDGLM